MSRSAIGAASGLGLRGRLDRAAGAAPGAEAATDMGDRLEPHPLRGLGRERRARAGGAEEHELAVAGEHRLVVLARGIEPELQHAARAVEGAGHPALAIELADVAQV